MKGREWFCRAMALNEALYGQQYDRLQGLLRQMRIKLEIPFHRYHICLTGLNKRFYAPRLDMDRDAFVAFHDEIEDHIRPYFKHRNCPMELTTVQYNHSKQICFLFDIPEGNPLDALEAAEFIQDTAQSLYQKNPLYANSGLYNVTSLSPLLTSYDELADAYNENLKLNGLSFFLMCPTVITDKRAAQWKKPFSVAQAYNSLYEVEKCVGSGNLEELGAVLRELFIHNLAKSLDYALVKDVLGEIKKKLKRYSLVYDLALDRDIDKVSLKIYPTIKELADALYALLVKCADASARYGNEMSSLSLDAIYYIKNNYILDIGLNDVAAHVHVSPAYLSRVFNKEAQESVPAYIARTRINQAAYLLESGDKKVMEIAREVGISNTQYFGKLFKKYMGHTPVEYRIMTGFGGRDF